MRAGSTNLLRDLVLSPKQLLQVFQPEWCSSSFRPGMGSRWMTWGGGGVGGLAQAIPLCISTAPGPWGPCLVNGWYSHAQGSQRRTEFGKGIAGPEISPEGSQGTLGPSPTSPDNTGETWGQCPQWPGNLEPQCLCSGRYRAGRQSPPWGLEERKQSEGIAGWGGTAGQPWVCLRAEAASEVSHPHQQWHQWKVLSCSFFLGCWLSVILPKGAGSQTYLSWPPEG